MLIHFLYPPSCSILPLWMEDPTTEQARLTTTLDELSAGLATLEAGRVLLDEIRSRPELEKAMKQAERAEQEQEKGNGPVAEGFSDLAKQALQQNARELRRAIRQATQAGKEKSEQLTEGLAGWGLEPGDLTQVPIEERLKLAERLMNHRMKML
ncbi:MAG: hypothetical protein A4E53_02270 [Pelotomaculum sp. PtaB.Bin104]|nr:MAG: hypothetical protein A4E53_02270 [Pelotomaculum sp. PtaB.Bin104]